MSEFRFTVFFENPFWVGVFERTCGGRLEACKITFGAEPRDAEVYAFLLREWRGLRFSPPVGCQREETRRLNPKRMQREIGARLTSSGVGTKAQQALKLQQEQVKQARKSRRKENAEEEKDRRFTLRQKKKKEKHRGK
jgi:hypothetical protein